MKKYDLEFRQQAVDLAKKSTNVSDAARNLGMSAKTLHRWVLEDKRQNHRLTPKSKSMSELEAEIKAIKKQNKELEQANYILKEAAAFFCLHRSK